jgi:hypothetical protein
MNSLDNYIDTSNKILERKLKHQFFEDNLRNFSFYIFIIMENINLNELEEFNIT